MEDFKCCKNCWHWNAVASRRDIDPSAYCKVIDDRSKPDFSCTQYSLTEVKVERHITRTQQRCEVAEVEHISTELYAHQRSAVDRYKEQKEIALFWEMGTGKSCTVLKITAEKFKAGEINALLVIAPNDVHKQWASQEIPMWLDVPYDLQLFGGRGGAKQTYPFAEDESMLQVVCVNIDTFSTPNKWKDVVEWANYKRTFIVLDEATVIKNPGARRTERLLYEFNDVVRKRKTVATSTKKLPGVRAVLTGTPVTNGPMDLWSMMEFLKPNYFGRNYYSFRGHYGMFTQLSINDRVIQVPLTEETWRGVKNMIEYGEAAAVFGVSEDTFNYIHSQDKFTGPYKHADELKKLLEPVASFKLLTDCVDMPEQNYIVRDLMMTDVMRDVYDSMVEEYIAEYKDHTATALNKMTVMIRLQQISSGFIYDKTYEQPEVEDNICLRCVHFNDGYCKQFDKTVEPKSDCGFKKILEDIVVDMTDEDDVLPTDPIQWIGTSNPKLEMLERDVAESAKPVIIITRFTAEADRIFNILSSSYRCCLMTGWKRIGTIQEFQEGKYDVMVANSAVVARGFNLQNSHTIIFYSNTFSLEQRLQAEGRIFRIGQHNNCQYIDYTYNDSVDEKIVSALRMKRNLLDYIRGVDVKELIN